MRRWAIRTSLYSRYILAYALLLAPLAGVFFSSVQAIPQVKDRFDQISDSRPSAIATHRFGFEFTDFTNSVGSISFEFCSNSPIPEVVCEAPNGFDASEGELVNQTGQTGFTISAADTTANKLVVTRPPAVPQPSEGRSTYRFDNIINPDTSGSYYVRIETFASQDGSGVALEDGGVVFVITPDFNISAEVPPFLLFCAAVTITGNDCDSATSFFIDLGEFSLSSPRAATSEMLAATNASYGYNVTLSGTTLTSGNNIINNLTNPNQSSPGNSQFGLNLRSNSNPSIGANPLGPGTASITADYSQPNRFKFVPGEAVISTPTTSDYRKFTVSYIVNISDNQPAGIYATTVSFVALANF